MTNGKTFLTCAVTGNTKPEQSPYLPITPKMLGANLASAKDAREMLKLA
jgi:uncharacterized protein (DUF849 family)